MSLRYLQSSFDSIRPMVGEEMSFEEFQDGHHGSHLGHLNRKILAILNHGGHLGHLNRKILAILNLCVTVMLPIKFWFNPTYGLGGNVI